MAQQITYDKAYDAVAPEDFPAMLEVPRYGRRSDAFDGIISATHDHFWDPLDKNYIDFDQPFDMENQALVPEDLVIALSTDYVSDHLSDPKQRIRFINQSVLRSFSSTGVVVGRWPPRYSAHTRLRSSCSSTSVRKRVAETRSAIVQPAAASVFCRFSMASTACSRIVAGRSNSSSRCGWLW